MRRGENQKVWNRLRGKGMPSPDAKPHPAEFEHSIVYFQYVFAAPRAPLHKVAQTLLTAGIAETVSSSVDGQVRMAPRYAELARMIAQLEGLAELSSEFERDGVHWSVLWRHPKLTWLILRKSLARSRADEEDRDPGDEPAEEFAARMGESVDEMKIAVAQAQSLSAIQHARERDLYQPAYLNSEPYLRLRLRSVHFSVHDATKSDLDEGQSADILLMLHRSGVMQLLIPCALPAGMNARDLLGRMRSDKMQIGWAELAEPVLSAATRQLGGQIAGVWLDDVAEGVRWRRMDVEGTLQDIFDIYLAAIESTLDFEIANGTWLCYQTTFLTPRCCRDEDRFRANHGAELLGLIARHESYGDLRDDPPMRLPRDSSIVRRHSSWIGHGNALVVDWGEERPTAFDEHLWTLLIVENYLLQSWQVRMLTWEVERQDPGLRARDLQRTLIQGLSEYYSSGVSFGSAEEILDDLRRESGLGRMHAEVIDRVDQLAALTAAERAEHVAVRSVVAGLAATLATLVLAVPALAQTMELASSAPTDGQLGWLLTPLRGLADAGAVGLWSTYLALLALLALIWLGTSLRLKATRRRSRFALQKSRPAGIEWMDGTVEIKRVDRPRTVSGSDI